MLAWNARRYLDSNYLLWLGIAYLWIAGIDLAHTLAYRGMNMFAGHDADLPTQLWIATRYLQADALLTAPIFVRRPLRPYPTMAGFGLVSAVVLVAIFARVFPTCYVEGVRLTRFTIIGEYMISLILLASLALLYRHRAAFIPEV